MDRAFRGFGARIPAEIDEDLFEKFLSHLSTRMKVSK